MAAAVADECSANGRVCIAEFMVTDVLFPPGKLVSRFELKDVPATGRYPIGDLLTAHDIEPRWLIEILSLRERVAEGRVRGVMNRIRDSCSPSSAASRHLLPEGEG